jgi:hypothetical protein
MADWKYEEVKKKEEEEEKKNKKKKVVVVVMMMMMIMIRRNYNKRSGRSWKGHMRQVKVYERCFPSASSSSSSCFIRLGLSMEWAT